MMKTGFAVGGPRNNVKLTASDNWHGKIQLPKVKPDAIKEFYPGRYRWDAQKDSWVWQVEEVTRASRTARSGGHNRKPLD